MTFTTEELKQLCHNSIPVVKAAGDFIREELGKVRQTEIEVKSLNSLVSYVDRRAEEMLAEGLGKLLPQAGFLTEEETVEQEQKPLRWIIDPLDGTTNFLFQLPVFSVSVALQKDDDLLVGIVYEVNQDECFFAWKDGGAYLNDRPIRVSSRKTLSESLIATGFPYYDYEMAGQYLQAMIRFMKSTRGLRRFGSAAVDLAYVACGRFDAFFEYSLHIWDIAAGVLLVREAGGRVTDFSGKTDELSGDQVLAASKEVYGDCQKIVGSSFGV